ncbi:unnamed protein product [Parajaminaea phylloscopi]
MGRGSRDAGRASSAPLLGRPPDGSCLHSPFRPPSPDVSRKPEAFFGLFSPLTDIERRTMSSSAKRLNRRQAREQQELEELRAAKAQSPEVGATEEGSHSDSDAGLDEQQTQVAPTSIFAALEATEDSHNADDSEDAEGESDGEKVSPQKKKSKKKKSKKKKKTANGVATGGAAEGTAEIVKEDSNTAPALTKPRKTGGKTGQKQAPSESLANMSLDDFDSLLASQPHLKHGEDAEGSSSARLPDAAGQNTPIGLLRSCLALSQNHLDPSIELKRQFGASAIRAYEAANGGTTGGGNRGTARARMIARNANLKVRSVLVQPRDDWPPISRTFTGQNGEVVDEPTDDGQAYSKIAQWGHTKAYRAVQYEFQQAVATYSPDALYALLPSYPWHIHLLSSMSDIARHQGDLGQAGDWNARILFAYERTASPVFVSSLTSSSGPMRVDFRKVENRGLFLAAHRMISFLGRRGTWRTALEWSKLLLALDPTDPHASLLWLDFLVIKSRQHKWFVEEFLPKLKASRQTLWLGGLDFAEALAVRALEKEKGEEVGSRSTQLLKQAIVTHPFFIPALASKISMPLSDGFADHAAVTTSSTTTFSSAEEQKNESLREILAQLYAVRSDSLWKESDLKDWLKLCLAEVWAEKKEESQWVRVPSVASASDMDGVWRHVISADMPDALRQQLTSLLPRSITSDSSNLDAYDPLPPASSPQTTRIDDEYFAPLLLRRGSDGGPSRARSTVPGEADAALGGEGMMGRIAAFANQLGRFFTQQQPAEGGDTPALQEPPGGLGLEDGATAGQGQHEMLRMWMDTLDAMSPEQREEMQRLFAAGAMVPPMTRNTSGDEDSADGHEDVPDRPQRGEGDNEET